MADDPARSAPSIFSHPSIALGFRPFFLLSGLFGVLWILLWLLQLEGRIQLPTGVPGTLWHGHEMVFGYTVAVVAGFLLTAVRNWTSRPTPTGGPLLFLALLWTAGRLALLFGGQLPAAIPAVIDLAFIPALAIGVARPIISAKNWRNLGFVPLLLLLFAANLVFHLGDPARGSQALRLAVNVIILIIVVVGGRVIPLFTGNATPEAKVQRYPKLDWLAFGSVALVAVLELFPGAWQAAAGAALLAALFNLARMWRWGSTYTLRRPILWVLHLGYLWIPIGFLMKGLTAFFPTIPPTSPLHALTVGSIGVLTLGMMSRVALGHTGRRLEVRPVIAVAFGLVGLATVVRAVLPMLAPGAYLTLLQIAALCWAAAFALFTVVYFPILTRPRVDGKPG